MCSTCSSNGMEDGFIAAAHGGPGITKKFELGQVAVTATAAAELPQMDMFAMFAAHQAGEWGNLDASDKKANEAALKNGDRILSRYEHPTGSYYVITEWDRSVTTLMRVEDY